MANTGRISFQGELGAYSHQACREMFPDYEVVPANSFEGAIAAVHEGRADLAMLPVDNSTYGRVADVHSLLPESNLNIIGEHFIRVHANLMAKKGSQLADIKRGTSHPVLLGQVRGFLRENGITPVIGADTAGSARVVSESDATDLGAFASEIAAEIYGLDILARHVEDHSHNTTRFLACSLTPGQATGDNVLTSFVFRVRNIPAALYKAMGGFATNSVNMVKLESYMINGSFTATQFYAEIEGQPGDQNVDLAMEELDYFTSYLRVLGSYDAAPHRLER